MVVGTNIETLEKRKENKKACMEYQSIDFKEETSLLDY